MNGSHNLSLMSIEYDILRETDFDDLITDFAQRKGRQVAGRTKCCYCLCRSYIVMPHMSLQSLHLFGHGVEVFSIILLPRGLHSPKSGTDDMWSRGVTRSVMGRMVSQLRQQLGL